MDLEFEDELALLTATQRAWAEEQLALRGRAKRIADAHGLEADEVAHILRHLLRSPAERLALGLRHGRLAASQSR